jgi:hypothetical protein
MIRKAESSGAAIYIQKTPDSNFFKKWAPFSAYFIFN